MELIQEIALSQEVVLGISGREAREHIVELTEIRAEDRVVVLDLEEALP